MSEFLWKWRREIVFSLLILVSLGVLVTQREPGIITRTLSQGVSFVIVPLQKWSSSGVAGGRAALGTLASLRQTRQQNQALGARVQQLMLENNLLHESRRESEVLRRELAYQRSIPWKFIPAEIIGRDPVSWTERAIIDRGVRDGVKPGAGVICPQGVVGRVMETNFRSATVMFLPDSQSSVSGRVERTNITGTVKGIGQKWLRMMYLSNEEDVRVGDVIVSSKLSHLFPPGLPIGDVVNVTPSETGLTLDIRIKPRVEFKPLDRLMILQPEE